MRHTFACRRIESGGTLAALQEILGHASIVTTQRYARLDEAHVRAEAQRIEGRLASKVASSEQLRGCGRPPKLLETLALERCESG